LAECSLPPLDADEDEARWDEGLKKVVTKKRVEKPE
jgi:hypothetical protein